MTTSNGAKTPGLRTVGYLVLLVVTVLGFWAMGRVLIEGHGGSNTTQIVPWGLWVAFYIFFLGLSAGSFLLSTLVYVFGMKRFEPIGPLALVQALGCLLLGGALIFLDLGHPERMYKILFNLNPTSAMAWMGLFYNFYIIIVVVELYYALRPQFVARSRGGGRGAGWARFWTFGYDDVSPAALAGDRARLKRLGILGIPIAVIVHGGVGTIFAVAKAEPNWFGGLFPILFLVSALASGGALLTFLTAFWYRGPRAEHQALVKSLAGLTIGILAFDLLLLLSDMLTALYGGIPYQVNAWRLVFFGPFWWVFWFIQLGLGAVVPILIVAGRGTRERTRWLGLAGFFIIIGMVGARLNIVIPAQIGPDFPGLVNAYHHPRFAYGYFPSSEEWLVALGITAIAVWLFIAARRWLPLEPESPALAMQGGIPR